VFFYGKDQILLVILEKSTKFWMLKNWKKNKPSCGWSFQLAVAARERL